MGHNLKLQCGCIIKPGRYIYSPNNCFHLYPKKAPANCKTHASQKGNPNMIRVGNELLFSTFDGIGNGVIDMDIWSLILKALCLGGVLRPDSLSV